MQGGFELNVTYHPMGYADVNLLNMNTVPKEMQMLLRVKILSNVYVHSHQKNAGHYQNIKVANRSFEIVTKYR
jgi:hypothetical protein